MPAQITAMRIILILLFVLLQSRGVAQDWPQFRGPDGRSVSSESGLPSNFDPTSASLKWKVEIPGSGNSSPSVSDGRVYLTTAYQGQELSRVRNMTITSTLALAVLVLLATARIMLHRLGQPPSLGWERRLSRLDMTVVATATVGFGGIACVAVLAPQFFWAPGIPGDTWLVTGAAGLLGLFAAFGWFPPRSTWRLLAIPVLLGCAWYAYQNLPLNKHHSVYNLVYRLALIAPAIFGALWHLLLYATVKNRPRGMSVAGALAMAALTAMTALVFVSSNFVNPQVGLVHAVVALDLETGELLWNVPLFVAPEERLHRTNSFATPTPCVSGERVFVNFGPGYACLDRDGNVLWQGRDEHYHEQSHYGAVSSPIAFEDTFILLHDTERQQLEYSYVMALDANSGETRWKIEPDYAHESYMTPSLMPVGGTLQLVTVTFGKVVAYDPRSGETLWSLELPTWQHVPSLTYDGDILFVSGGAHNKWVTAALRLHGSGKDTMPEILWQTKRAVPTAASPVHYEGKLYTVTDGGIMVCYEPATGKQHWKERLGGVFLSSLVAGSGMVYACSEEGEVVVIEASSEFRIVSRSNPGGGILATPGISRGNFLIRTDRHLFCFGAK